jgi:PIN domain nuclease of toxin-antitoxin system
MQKAEQVILDASALLAFARNEPGADRVRRSLASASMSAVTVAECVAVLSRFTSVAVATEFRVTGRRRYSRPSSTRPRKTVA